MRWIHGHHPGQRRTDDDRYVVNKDAPDSFAAWGPIGSQDIDYIRANTAKAIRDLMQKECRPEDLKMASGRGLLGLFNDPMDAKKACEDHAEARSNAPSTDGIEMGQGRPTSRTTDPQSSHDAIAALEASGELGKQHRRALEAVRRNNGMTSKHLAQLTGLDRHMLGRRLPELERSGLVKRGPMVKGEEGRAEGVTWWTAA